MKNTLANTKRPDKTKLPVKCPFCAMRLTICYGYYQRLHPETSELIDIPRYKCNVKACPVCTFSILPYPLLRVIRHAYLKVRQIYSLAMSQVPQAAASRISGLSRGVVKRLYKFTRRFFPWLEREQGILAWGPDFESNPCSVWPAFIRDFSHAFYPKKWGI